MAHVIPVPAGQSVIVEESHRNYDRNDRYGRDNDDTCDILSAVKDSTINTNKVVTDSAARSAECCCKIMGDVKDARYDLFKVVSDNTNVLQQGQNRISDSIKDARYDLSQVTERGIAANCANFANVNEHLSDHFERTNSKVCELGKETQHGFAHVQKSLCDISKDMCIGFKDAQGLAYQVEGRALLESAKNAAAIQLQAEKLAAASALQAEKLSAASSLEAVKNASASQLLATQIASQAAAQAAECCCELKSLIKEESDKGRALAASIERDQLRDKLAEQNAKLVALEYCRNGGHHGGNGHS